MLHAAPLILIYGDSLSAAYGLPASQGWGALLGQKLADRYQVVNASVSGETTSGGLARLDNTLRQHQPALVLLELGANDALRGLPLDQAEKKSGDHAGKNQCRRGIKSADRHAPATQLWAGLHQTVQRYVSATGETAQYRADAVSVTRLCRTGRLFSGGRDPP